MKGPLKSLLPVPPEWTVCVCPVGLDAVASVGEVGVTVVVALRAGLAVLCEPISLAPMS